MPILFGFFLAALSSSVCSNWFYVAIYSISSDVLRAYDPSVYLKQLQQSRIEDKDKVSPQYVSVHVEQWLRATRNAYHNTYIYKV